jgi:hypothetical protein
MNTRDENPGLKQLDVIRRPTTHGPSACGLPLTK